MERPQLEELIKLSLDEFFINDQDLIDVDINERSMSHKIAEYIQKRIPKRAGDEVPEWNVDCEYNGDEEHHPKRLGLDPQTIQSDDAKGTTVYPDIIIHKRRKKKENLLVIEIKKSGLDCTCDIKKINAFIKTEKYSYKFGLMLIINVPYNSEKPYDWEWFS